MKWLYLLGYLCMPAALAVRYWHVGQEGADPSSCRQAVTFILSCLSIVPLAGLMGMATEHLAVRTGPLWGGLLNATFGNAAELIIGVVAISRGFSPIAKASLAGSILGNLLLVMGGAMLVGGLRRRTQQFSPRTAEASAGLLVVAVCGMLLPGIFHFSFAGSGQARVVMHEQSVSVGTSVVLLTVYCLGLLFTLKTLRPSSSLSPVRGGEGRVRGGTSSCAEFEDPLALGPSPQPSAPNTGEREQEIKCHRPEAVAGQQIDSGHWPVRKSIWALALAAAATAVFSELLVGSVHSAASALHLNPTFVGVILIAIVGNATEHASAILLAHRGDMDTAMSIAIQSSLQIALFVTPLLVLLSWAAGTPTALRMDMIFSPLEVIGVLLSVAIVVTLIRNGESNWFEGALLLAVYAILAITFFYIPSPG